MTEEGHTQSGVRYKLVQGGGVPGGHRCIYDGKKPPFITPVKELSSIDLRYSDVLVDIGAYVGTCSLRAARFPVKRVVAYEPTFSTVELLRMSALPNLEIINAAVVGPTGPESVTLHISNGIGVTNSIVLSKRKARSVVVPAVKYADAVFGASVVKIDVEGAEYNFGDLVTPTLRALIIDFHPIPDFDWQKAAGEMIESLLDRGFRPIVTPDWSNGWTCAGCWVRDLEDPGGAFEPMVFGQVCCGCGSALVQGPKSRSICPNCAGVWSKKHRVGYYVRGLLT